jgi:hypothetical protein
VKELLKHVRIHQSTLLRTVLKDICITISALSRFPGENKRVFNALIFALLVCTSTTSYGFSANDASKTIASNGSLADTQAALNYVASKAQDGWVLTVGAAGSSYTWSGAWLKINIPHVFTMQGASPTNPPTITSTYAGGQDISVHVTNSKTVTIKDIHFKSWAATGSLFGVTGSGVDCYRFTNLTFTGTRKWAIWVSSAGDTTQGEGPYGLIDHVVMPSGGCLAYVRDNPAANPNSWHRPMTWGTKKAVYIEDSKFLAVDRVPMENEICDGDNGARIVVRHNTIQDFQQVTHGPDSNGTTKSSLQHEYMHNTWTVTDGVGAAWAMFIRGGTAVIFDNTLNKIGSGWYNNVVKCEYYRANANNGVCAQDRFYPADYVGTQQPGCGYVGVTGQDPKYPSAPWGSVPIYYWNNHINAPLSFSQFSGSTAGFMQLNRDYFIGTAKPGYTEYTYPHPLQAGATAALAPPSNLTISP